MENYADPDAGGDIDYEEDNWDEGEVAGADPLSMSSCGCDLSALTDPLVFPKIEKNVANLLTSAQHVADFLKARADLEKLHADRVAALQTQFCAPQVSACFEALGAQGLRAVWEATLEQQGQVSARVKDLGDELMAASAALSEGVKKKRGLLRVVCGARREWDKVVEAREQVLSKEHRKALESHSTAQGVKGTDGKHAKKRALHQKVAENGYNKTVLMTAALNCLTARQHADDLPLLLGMLQERVVVWAEREVVETLESAADSWKEAAQEVVGGYEQVGAQAGQVDVERDVQLQVQALGAVSGYRPARKERCTCALCAPHGGELCVNEVTSPALLFDRTASEGTVAQATEAEAKVRKDLVGVETLYTSYAENPDLGDVADLDVQLFEVRCKIIKEAWKAATNRAKLDVLGSVQLTGDGPAGTAGGPPKIQHTWVWHSYKRPTFCKYCSKLLVGLRRQGLRCKACNLDIHENCKKYVEAECLGKARKSIMKTSGSMPLNLATTPNQAPPPLPDRDDDDEWDPCLSDEWDDGDEEIYEDLDQLEEEARRPSISGGDGGLKAPLPLKHTRRGSEPPTPKAPLVPTSRRPTLPPNFAGGQRPSLPQKPSAGAAAAPRPVLPQPPVGAAEPAVVAGAGAAAAAPQPKLDEYLDVDDFDDVIKSRARPDSSSSAGSGTSSVKSMPPPPPTVVKKPVMPPRQGESGVQKPPVAPRRQSTGASSHTVAGRPAPAAAPAAAAAAAAATAAAAVVAEPTPLRRKSMTPQHSSAARLRDEDIYSEEEWDDEDPGEEAAAAAAAPAAPHLQLASRPPLPTVPPQASVRGSQRTDIAAQDGFGDYEELDDDPADLQAVKEAAARTRAANASTAPPAAAAAPANPNALDAGSLKLPYEAKAIAVYSAQNPEQLGLKVGEKVTILQTFDDGLVLGKKLLGSRYRKGKFPLSCLGPPA